MGAKLVLIFKINICMNHRFADQRMFLLGSDYIRWLVYCVNFREN